MDGDVSVVQMAFKRQDHVGITRLVQVLVHSLDLLPRVLFEGLRRIDMPKGDVELHAAILLETGAVGAALPSEAMPPRKATRRPHVAFPGPAKTSGRV